MTFTRRLAILAVLVLLLSLPALASASPGRLIVAPLHGRGLITASPSGGQVRRICTDASLCGRPGAPSASPNGQAIAFIDRHSGRPVIIAHDGTCLWCLGHGGLPAHRGTGVRFAGDGTLILLGSRGAGVRTIPLTGVRRPVTGTGTAAGTSVHGARVTAAHGSIFVRSRPHARPRPIARGSSPAWSPSGRRIAFVAPGGQIETMSRRGTQRRAIGALRGRSVTWSRSPGRSCAGPGPVVDQSSTAVLRQRGTETQAYWTACLRLTGEVKTIAPSNTIANHLVTSALAGRYLAIENRFGSPPHQIPGCKLRLIDLGRGRLVVSERPAEDQCTARTAIDDVHVSTGGIVVWRDRQQVGPADRDSADISCPTAHLCLTPDDGALLVSRSPDSPAHDWRRVRGPRTNALIFSIDCPSARFCLVSGDAGAFASDDPLGGRSTWTHVARGHGGHGSSLGEASCPTASFCAIVVSSGISHVQAVVSSDPTGAGDPWSPVSITGDPQNAIESLSCASPSLCAAVSSDGNLYTSTHPATDGSWTRVAGTQASSPVTCPSVSLCLAVGPSDHGLIASTDPADAGRAWTRIPVPGEGPIAGADVACGSAQLCVAALDDGLTSRIYTSSDPATPGSWASATTPGGLQPTGSLFDDRAGCAGTALCVLQSSGGGTAWVSRRPADPSSYNARPLVGPIHCVIRFPCPRQTLNAESFDILRTLDTTTPGLQGQIADVRLTQGGRTVRWTDNGRPRSARLP